jgi:hypothetical protein
LSLNYRKDVSWGRLTGGSRALYELVGVLRKGRSLQL